MPTAWQRVPRGSDPVGVLSGHADDAHTAREVICKEVTMPPGPPGPAVQVVVMGVSGTGKTTVATVLARWLGGALADADEFHPTANLTKMASGAALDDADRAPWLSAIAAWLAEHAADAAPAVVTCSALKRRYREVLRTAGPSVRFVHLHGSRELIADRMRHRRGHFMPLELLDSQLADLEPLGDDELGVTLDVAPPPESIGEQALRALDLHGFCPWT